VSHGLDPNVEIERAAEQIRQERETFDQRKRQDSRWFFLRLAMGWVAVLLLPAIFLSCIYILYHNATFSDLVIELAVGGLFVDVVGLLAAVWKIVLSPSSVTKLDPITHIS
jgi:hypothetical protein